MHSQKGKYVGSSKKQFFEGMFYEGKMEKNVNAFADLPPEGEDSIVSNSLSEKIYYGKADNEDMKKGEYAKLSKDEN
jgi:hypothetical protein